ncbi:MAG: ATP synthase F0 subunit alpha, F-type H+-transporting ATPase subunit a, partial [Candidatus Peregrinibacteria bacterium GW2011_GWF2_33_10]
MSEIEINVENVQAETSEGHSGVHVPALKPETLFNIGPITVSNAMFSGFIVTILICILIAYVKKHIRLVPTRVQVVAEAVVNMFYEPLIDAYHDRALAKKHAAIITSFFILIIVSNLLPALPIIPSLRWGHEVEVARPVTSHYSFTLALAMISLVIAHILGLAHHGWGHVGKFFKFAELFKIKKIMDLPNVLIEIFVGILEVFGEFSKIISLASRLFGNLLAHEAIMAVIFGISVYTQFLAPIPFYLLGFLV